MYALTIPTTKDPLQIPKEIAKNPNLSFETLGFLVFLLAFDVTEIEKGHTEQIHEELLELELIGEVMGNDV